MSKLILNVDDPAQIVAIRLGSTWHYVFEGSFELGPEPGRFFMWEAAPVPFIQTGDVAQIMAVLAHQSPEWS